MMGHKIAKTILVYSVALIVYINVLSLFHVLSRRTMLPFTVAFLCYLIFTYRNEIRKGRKNIQFWMKQTASSEKLLEIIVLGYIVISFIFALFTVPYNGDSLDYHLPRLMHWIQEKSVNYYTKNIYDLRETVSPVLGEYYMLHNYFFTDSDILVNLVQWFSYSITAIMIFCIARKIKLSKIEALIASILFLSSPICFAESITTQVDLVACMWVSIFLFYWIDLVQLEHFQLKSDFKSLFLCAASLGFAYLAKSSSCFPIIGFLLVLFIVRIVQRDSILEIIKAIIGAFIIVLCIVSESFIRLYVYLGSVIPFKYTDEIMIGTLSPKYCLMNMYKNISMLQINDFFDAYKECLVRFGNIMGNLFGIDIDDKLITFGSTKFSDGLVVSYHHDLAGSPWLIILLVISAILLCFWRKKNPVPNKVQNNFVIAAVCGFIISNLFIRWQPWVTRLLLPSVVSLPIVVMVLQSHMRISKRISYTIIAWTCMVTSIKVIEYNSWRAIDYCKSGFVNRTSQHCTQEYTGEDYTTISNYILSQNGSSLGLVVNGECHEYILWELLSQKIYVEHVTLDKEEFVKYKKDQEHDGCCIPDFIFVGMDFDENTFEYKHIIYEKIDLNIEKKKFYLYKKRDMENDFT